VAGVAVLANQWLAAMEQRGREDPAFAARARTVDAVLDGWKNEDALLWHGWFSRHEGTVTFWGDHVAPGSEWLIAAGMLGLMAAMIRALRRVRPEPAVAAFRPTSALGVTPSKRPGRKAAGGRGR